MNGKDTINILMNKELPVIPEAVFRKLSVSEITGTAFEDKNQILQDIKLQQEIGFKKMPDGTYLVSMTSPMPDVTTDMVRWWFWWHPQADERYKVWFPGEHLGIGYSKKQKEYFSKRTCPEFQNNTHFPLERIGNSVLPLRIDFVSAKEFGFSEETMKENNIPLIVCGHVGVFRGLVMHTEMAHIFKQTDNGLMLISRFWLGKTMRSKLLKKLIINDDMALSMAKHCCVEYRNLNEILPQLYNEFNYQK